MSGVMPSTWVCIPLYIYPLAMASWQFLYTEIETYSSTTFSVIIDSETGPGRTTYPNSDYAPNIAKMNSYPGVQTLGYVATDYGNRPLADIEDDINVYRNWATYQPLDIHMDGIFFDQAPTMLTNFDILQQASDHVKQTFPDGKNWVTLNPGDIVDRQWFSIADSIVQFEGNYTSYNFDALNQIPADLRLNTTVLLHDFNGTASQQDGLERELIVNLTMGSIYITTGKGFNPYNTTSDLFPQFCASLAQYNSLS